MKWIISLRTFAAVFLMLTFFAAGSFGFDKPSHAQLPDFDKRAATAKEKELRGERVLAAERLKQRVPQIRVDLDELRGAPKFVASTDGFLSGPNGEGRGISADPAVAGRALPANDAHRPIKAFLNEHSALYGHGAEALAPARLKRDYTSGHNGLRTVVWEQQLDNIAVYEAVMVGHMTRRGELVNLASQFVPDPEQAANAGMLEAGGAPPRAAVVATPAISALQALSNAARELHEEVEMNDITALDARPEGAEKRQRFKARGLPGEAELRLVWLPMSRTSLRLCWQVDLTRREGGERFRVLIDVQTGEAVLRRCLTVYLSDATYRVFTSDSPSALSPGFSAPSTNQPPLVSRSLVTLSALSTNASPLGWIHDGENQTRGNNVDAHSDIDADDLPDLPRPQGSPFRVFDFPIDFTQSPSNYTDAAAVQLFYWCNWMHDQLYELGFTEAAGNYQKDNFGRGGLGSDAIQADAQDGSGVNNANFTPSPDGVPGRIQMFVFTGPDPDRDGDFDAEIILHEYAHGLSDRLVGGGVGINFGNPQSGGMGEGWSDFYGLSLLGEPGDDLNGTYPEGGYATFQFLGLAENYYFGIRRYPYSTDMTKNPLTFKDIDPNQIDPHASVPISPIHGFNPLFANEVHNAGEVWCVTLWEMRANLIRKHGFAAGNRLTLQLVTDGMKLSPPNPNFLQGRDAIVQADIVNTGGQNWNELWAAFAKRGMGFSAFSPPSSSTFGVMEAFDLPDALLIVPTTGFLSSGPEHDPLAPLCKTYTLTNHSTFPFAWTASVTQPWVTVSPASGSLAPGTGANVQVCLSSAADALPIGDHQAVITFSNLTTGVAQAREVDVRIMSFASMPFVEDFESGMFQSYWMITGKGGFRSQVTQQSGPHGGLYHLTMDNNGSGEFSRNEVTLGIDLAGFTNVVLRFWAKHFGDEPDGPPTVPFIGGADFDGVAISADGVAWYEAQGLRNLQTTHSQWVVDLDEALRARGLTYGPNFRIRFNQYDNLSIPFDGVAVDDISLTGIPARRLLLTVPEVATEGDGVLANRGKVTVALPVSRDVAIHLSSSDPSKATVPPTVTILAGATQAVFNVNIVDNNLLDGTQPVSIGATAPDFFSHDAIMLVNDNDSGTLKIMLPRPRGREGDPPLQAKLRSSKKPAKDIMVRLTSSNTNEAQVLPVILPAGKNSVEFPIGLVDDRRIDGSRRVTITAHVENWVDDSVVIEIEDNDLPVLSVTLPTSASEGNGVLTNAGQVSLASAWPTDLTVSLSSSAPADLMVPGSVTIRAGEFSAPFNLMVVDDSDLEGLQDVTVTASAFGFNVASSAMTVIDDETPPTPYDPSPADRSSDNPITTDLSWRGGIGEIVVNGGFETGDFTGWQQRNIDFGAFVINDGKLDPEGPDAPLPPFDGNFNAVTEQIGGGSHVLYQDVFIPADAKSARFSWADRIRNHGLQFSPGNQEFRVEIRDTSDNVLALAYTTRPGDRALNDWVQRSFDLTAFRGRAIRLAFFEEDHLGYFNVHLDNISVILGSSGATAFEVYFGTNAVPGPAQFLGTTTNAHWDLPTLALDTSYYWRVVSKRGAAQVAGPIWQFTTRGVGEIHHFEWSTIPGTQFVDQPFPVTLTARDDLNNTITSFDGAVELTALPGSGTASAVVITEVDTALNDRVEFANVSGRRLDISGWQIVLYDGRSWPAPRITVTVPTNTFVSSGALFLLTVPGTPPGAFPNFIAGTNIIWNNNVISNQVAVLLRDAAGSVVDFMCAVEANPAQIANPISIPAEEWMGNPIAANTNTTRTFQRIGNIDHNDHTDWIVSTNNIGRFQSGLERIFESRAPIPVLPTTVADFAGGVWSGQLTVQRTIPAMTVLADDGQGRLGMANVFAVSAVNDVSVNIADSPDLVIFGDDLTYSIVVSNTGPGAALGVNLIDDLPEGVALVSAASSQGSCVNLEGNIWCALGTLAAGSRATITIAVTPSATGPLTNTAYVTRIEPDSYLPNNAAVAVSTVNFPLLFITSPNVVEGNTGTTNEIFHVRLTAPSRLPVSVDYATADITAIAGEDYIPVAGTLSFPPGTTSQTVTVPVIGERLDEIFEMLAVNLSSPTNAGLLVTQGRGRITDDDSAPALFISDAMVTEGPPGSATSMIFTARLSAVSGLPIAATFVTANRTALATKDYMAKSGVVMFPPGVSNQTITIAVEGDTIYETNETFVVNLINLANALIGDTEGVGTIFDNGFVDLDHFDWSTIPSPQYANVPFTVTLTARDGRDTLFPGFSESVALTALARSQEMTVGAGTNIWENPLGTLFHDGRTQIIYLAGELGGAGLISALALDVTAVPGQTLSNWTIRLKHTALASYGQPSWEGSGWTTVYRQNQNLSDTGWTTFFFHTPFAYDGTNNLMVDFSFDNSSYTSDGQCRVSATAQSRTVYFRTDGAFGNPLAWTGTTAPPPSAIRHVPNIRLLVENPITIAPAQSDNFVNGTWTGIVTIVDPATNVFLRALHHTGRAGTGNTFAVESLADTDGDGLPDSWELRYFGSLSEARGGADEDPDGDGLTNLQEFRAGTHPTDAGSSVRITAVRLVGGQVRITFPSVAGKRYRVERTDSLTGAPWGIAADNVAGTGADVEVVDSTEGSHSRFYRARLLP